MARYICSLSLLSLALLGGCAQGGDSEAAATAAPDAPAEALHATVKPGAGVAFSHDYEGPIRAGERGSIGLTISEAYDSGILKLEVITDDGLDVFGSSVSKTLQMSGGETHNWRISFGAVKDGVQYLRIRAVAEPDGAPAAARSYAVRIDVGDTSAASEKSSGIPVTTTADGEAVIVMEAEETIK